MYNKLTKKFTKNGGIIIRGEEAERHLKKSAYASYLPSMNAAFISDEPSVSDVLEEMYHAEQDRRNMFGNLSTAIGDKGTEILLRREINAQKYLLSLTDKYKIPQCEVDVTKANLDYYEKQLEELLRGV